MVISFNPAMRLRIGIRWLHSCIAKSKKRVKGQNNRIFYAKSVRLFNCIFDVEGDDNEISIGDFSMFRNVSFYIRGNNNKIQIKNNVHFSTDGSIWIEDDECMVVIAEYSTFEDVHIAATEPKSSIVIGKDCMFANGIDVRTGDSHSIIDSVSKKRINRAQNVIIGNHVWVASHVSILKGATLPDNSVVATRSVVTKSFSEENILIGGIPARILKSNIDWIRERI